MTVQIAINFGAHRTVFRHTQISICLLVYIYIYWFVAWNIYYFSIWLGIIIPTDFHIFQMGRSTTNQYISLYVLLKWLVYVGVVPSSSYWIPNQWYVQIFAGYISHHINLYVYIYIIYIYNIYIYVSQIVSPYYGLFYPHCFKVVHHP